MLHHAALLISSALWPPEAQSTCASEDVLSKAICEVQNSPRERSPGDVLAPGLKRFHGKAVQQAFSVLGYPDRKMVVEGTTVYRWINTATNLDGGALSCTITIGARKSVVVRTDFHGNNGACARFARAIDPTFTARY